MKWLAFTFALLLAAGRGASEEMPRVLTERRAGMPWYSFVDAQELLNPSEDVHPLLLQWATSEPLQRLLDCPETDGCIRVGGGGFCYTNDFCSDGSAGPATFAEILRRAAAVIEAEVTGRAYGLMEGRLGQLLRVSPARVWKGEVPDRSEFYFFLPAGSFWVGEKQFCVADRRYAREPAIGETVFLFIEGFRGDGEVLRVFEGSGLLAVNRSGAVSMPPALSDAPRTAKDLDSFLQTAFQSRAP